VEEAEAMARQGRDIAMRNPSLPEDQRMQVDAALGLVLIRQGHAEEAEPLLVDAEKYCVANSWDRVNPGQPDLAAIQSALAQIRAARERGAAPDR
jgi:hypothetical protein